MGRLICRYRCELYRPVSVTITLFGESPGALPIVNVCDPSSYTEDFSGAPYKRRQRVSTLCTISEFFSRCRQYTRLRIFRGGQGKTAREISVHPDMNTDYPRDYISHQSTWVRHDRGGFSRTSPHSHEIVNRLTHIAASREGILHADFFLKKKNMACAGRRGCNTSPPHTGLTMHMSVVL